MANTNVTHPALHRNFLQDPQSDHPLSRQAYHRRHAQARAVPAPVSPTIKNQQHIITLSGVDTGNPRDSHRILMDAWLARETAFAAVVAEIQASA